MNRKTRRKRQKTTVHLKLVSTVKAAKRSKNSPNYLGDNLEITVLVPKAFAVKALTDQKTWKDLWGEIIPGQCRQAALELKGLVLNDFKPIKNDGEMRDARAKMVELEKPGPILSVVPAEAQGMPDVDDPAVMGALLVNNGFTPSTKKPIE